MKLLAHARKSPRRGGVLALSLFAVGVVATLSVAFLQMSAGVTRRQVAATDAKLAFYLSEAGLAEAYSGVLVGRTGRIGSREEPAILGDGLLWVEATWLGSDYVDLRSTGMAKSGTATLGMTLRRGKTKVGSLGVFSHEDLVLSGPILVDGYDSSNGSYEEQKAADPNTVSQARVGSNGSVTLDATAGTAEVRGNVLLGPSGELTTVAEPTLTGSATNGAIDVALDPVEMPEGTAAAGYTHPAGVALVVPAGTYKREYLHLDQYAELTLQGPMTLSLAGLRLARGAEINLVTTDGPIEIYVSGYLQVHPEAALANAAEDASDVTINVVGSATVDVGAAAPFHGVIYAPESAVSVRAGFELFGGLVAQSLALGSGVSLHYDANLVEAGADATLPKVISWRIIELPLDSAGRSSGDPFEELGLDPATLEPPARSHEDQWLDVRYMPEGGGSAVTYSGWESDFDWSIVETVLSLRRTGGLVSDDIAQIVKDGALGFLP